MLTPNAQRFFLLDKKVFLTTLSHKLYRASFLRVFHIRPVKPLKCNALENSQLIPALNGSTRSCCNLSQNRLGKNHSCINRNGRLRNPLESLSIAALGDIFAQKFCHTALPQEILQSHEKTVVRRGGKFVTPTISNDQRSQIRSCTSLRIAACHICWARLELGGDEKSRTPYNLTHWSYYEMQGKKMTMSDLVQQCMHVDGLIPAADCYILEDPQTIKTNLIGIEQQSVNVQKSQMMAVLSFALATRMSETTRGDDTVSPDNIEPRELWPIVFYLRKFTTARLFKHLVGNEQVSSEHTVLNLMQASNVELNTLNHIEKLDNNDVRASYTNTEAKVLYTRAINFPTELRHSFTRGLSLHREILSRALLQNLAFTQLALQRSYSHHLSNFTRIRSEENK